MNSLQLGEIDNEKEEYRDEREEKVRIRMNKENYKNNNNNDDTNNVFCLHTTGIELRYHH